MVGSEVTFAALMMLEPGILITLALSCIGAVIWAVRVEGRVNGHDKSFIDFDRLLSERDARSKERDTELGHRLFRIESKIDAGFKNHVHVAPKSPFESP